MRPPLDPPEAAGWDPPTIASFEWSGENTHEARLSAARALAAHVRSISADREGGKVHFVAHSHGGNVVLAAVHELLRSASDESRAARHPVGRIVLMGTPFLQKCWNRARYASVVRRLAHGSWRVHRWARRGLRCARRALGGVGSLAVLAVVLAAIVAALAASGSGRLIVETLVWVPKSWFSDFPTWARVAATLAYAALAGPILVLLPVATLAAPRRFQRAWTSRIANRNLYWNGSPNAERPVDCAVISGGPIDEVAVGMALAPATVDLFTPRLEEAVRLPLRVRWPRRPAGVLRPGFEFWIPGVIRFVVHLACLPVLGLLRAARVHRLWFEPIRRVVKRSALAATFGVSTDEFHRGRIEMRAKPEGLVGLRVKRFDAARALLSQSPEAGAEIESPRTRYRFLWDDEVCRARFESATELPKFRQQVVRRIRSDVRLASKDESAARRVLEAKRSYLVVVERAKEVASLVELRHSGYHSNAGILETVSTVLRQGLDATAPRGEVGR